MILKIVLTPVNGRVHTTTIEKITLTHSQYCWDHSQSDFRYDRNTDCQSESVLFRHHIDMISDVLFDDCQNAYKLMLIHMKN